MKFDRVDFYAQRAVEQLTDADARNESLTYREAVTAALVAAAEFVPHELQVRKIIDRTKELDRRRDDMLATRARLAVSA